MTLLKYTQAKRILPQVAGLCCVLLVNFPLAAREYKQQTLPETSASQFQKQTSANNSKKVPFAEMKLGKLQPFISEEEARIILGKPNRVENTKSEALGAVRILRYPGLTVEMVQNDAPGKKNSFFVYLITTTDSKYATPSGVRIGDTRAKVVKTYGKPAEESRNVNQVVLTYNGDVENFPYSGMIFKIQNGKVTEITCLVNVT